MDNTPSVEEMAAVVEAYIYERKGVKARIIFEPMRLRKDVRLLNEAYSYILAYNNKQK